MTDVEWAEIVDEIRGRWPKWKPSVVEVGDWKRALTGYSVETVREALYEVKTSYASREPSLKWAIDAVRSIKRAQRAQNDVSSQTPSEPVSRVSMLTHLTALSDEQLAEVKAYAGVGLPQRVTGSNDSPNPNDWADEVVVQCYRVATMFGVSAGCRSQTDAAEEP